MKYLAIAVFLISVIIISATGANQNPIDEAKSKERANIKFCWEGYERKSLSASEKQFIASTCEMMEEDFLKKHHVKPCFGSSCAPS